MPPPPQGDPWGQGKPDTACPLLTAICPRSRIKEIHICAHMDLAYTGNGWANPCPGEDGLQQVMDNNDTHSCFKAQGSQMYTTIIHQDSRLQVIRCLPADALLSVLPVLEALAIDAKAARDTCSAHVTNPMQPA
eukprot:CAMPEP_0174323272 /NCGR_PEP_ID=MMETSP0810-20121108/11672_1 /TAXON_ID=73025 ORGANISM="Eutreptiella gymnastica-like, Strain CCMP1594" /NCGR_SAMPLE_ID=MMETSP0810 /ASSEMBLY_ACC=CAM_ASM_000659 /LENGTH=133 /DNA_ID=CAMNT_0015435595 /DNA_START=567 /DNA_END=969 /DNA_ORIENTATION=-